MKPTRRYSPAVQAASQKDSLVRWLIGTVIAVVGLAGAVGTIWQLAGSDRFGVQVSSGKANTYEIRQAVDAVTVSPMPEFRRRVAEDPGLSGAFPSLVIDLTNLGPRGISINALELRFVSLDTVPTPPSITMLLRAPNIDMADLNTFPVRIVRQDNTRVRLAVTNGA